MTDQSMTSIMRDLDHRDRECALRPRRLRWFHFLLPFSRAIRCLLQCQGRAVWDGPQKLVVKGTGVGSVDTIFRQIAHAYVHVEEQTEFQYVPSTGAVGDVATQLQV